MNSNGMSRQQSKSFTAMLESSGDFSELDLSSILQDSSSHQFHFGATVL
jgi:hypothetical protein